MSVTYGCISCLETDNIFNIYDTHECEGIEEVYANMLKNCFDVSISENPLLNHMCENCILNLRQAYYFKQNVVKNLEALETALAALASHNNIQDGTSHPLGTHLQMEEQLDPDTGQMTLILTTKDDDDGENVFVQCKEFEVIGNIRGNHEEINNGCIRKDFVNSLADGNNDEGIKNMGHVNNDEQLAKEALEDEHFECGDCGKKFSTKVAIARHVKIHLRGIFPCHMCGKEFSKLNTRNSHQWRVHRTREPYACAHCDLRFTTFHQRLRHLEVDHGQKNEYPCPHCDNIYSYTGALSVHVRQTHLHEHRYHCSECKMGFFKRRALLSHLASVHGIGEKKHVCPICDKSFYRFPVLRTHMKTHTEKALKDKQHKCHICSAQFTYKTVLKNHMKFHEAESQDRPLYLVQQNVPVE